MNGKKRLFLSLLVFVLVFAIGVAGFRIFGGSDWSLLDSLYMTVITMATVGYEETLDLNANPAARIFTIIFIILCLGTIAFAVTSITSFIVEGELKNILGRKRMEKEIARLRDHYIVCGSDETAQTIIQELILTKRKFVVIESAKEKIEKLSTLGNVLAIHGDATEEDQVLLSAGIEKAKGILLSLPTDEENLFVSLTARSLNPNLRIVSKVVDLNTQKKMKKAGSDAVVSPTFIGGMRMVSEMVRPVVVTFLDTMLRERENVLRFEEVKVGAGSPLAGKTAGEAKIDEKSDALLVAVKKAGSERYEFNPAPEFILGENDILVLIATPEGLGAVEKLAEGS